MRMHFLLLVTLVLTIVSFGQQTFKRNDITWSYWEMELVVLLRTKGTLASKPGFGIESWGRIFPVMGN
jgi:hypothetical protein